MTVSALSQRAHAAYGATAAPTRTERGTEYAVFATVTQRMKAASDRGSVGFPELAAALRDNSRLWTVLASDVADAANGLPKDLRARIFYLAEFTLQHTGAVLRREADVRPLLDINVAIMKGLAGKASATGPDGGKVSAGQTGGVL